MHRLLERQLRKCYGSLSRVPPPVSRFLETVDHAYERFDVERRALEGKNRTLLEESRDAICVTSLDGRLLDLNLAAVRGLGLESREDGLNEQVLQFYADPTERRALIEGLETNGYLEGREVRLQTRDGRQIVVQVSSVPIRGEGGDIVAIRSTLRDVTHERALQRELVQVQKIEAIGRLAGGVAHDFNNILTTIVGCSDLLSSSVDEDSDLRPLVDDIREAARRGGDLTQRLLAFGRRQNFVERELDLNEIVSDVEQLLGRLIGDDIEIETRLESIRPSVRGDRSHIEQVIVGLGINARDAMPEGGRLLFSTADLVVPNLPDAERAPVPPGAYVQLSVQDTGSGIDEEIREFIFEPFFTTKTADRGQGPGLTTVYNIVRQSNGHIRVASGAGEGTTFEILWPQTLEPADSVAEVVDPATPEPTAASGVQILVVDDDEGVRSLAARVLRKHGFQALEAAGGEEALRLFAAPENSITFLVSDVVMPGIQGPELAARLRGHSPHLKVLLMSGYAESLDLLKQSIEPSTAFLQKPFSPSDLVAKVEGLLD